MQTEKRWRKKKLEKRSAKRTVTFQKRKLSLMKKGFALGKLTGAEVLVIAARNGLVFSYGTKKLQRLIDSPAGRDQVKSCMEMPMHGDDRMTDDLDMQPCNAKWRTSLIKHTSRFCSNYMYARLHVGELHTRCGHSAHTEANRQTVQQEPPTESTAYTDFLAWVSQPPPAITPSQSIWDLGTRPVTSNPPLTWNCSSNVSDSLSQHSLSSTSSGGNSSSGSSSIYSSPSNSLVDAAGPPHGSTSLAQAARTSPERWLTDNKYVAGESLKDAIRADGMAMNNSRNERVYVQSAITQYTSNRASIRPVHNTHVADLPRLILTPEIAANVTALGASALPGNFIAAGHAEHLHTQSSVLLTGTAGTAPTSLRLPPTSVSLHTQTTTTAPFSVTPQNAAPDTVPISINSLSAHPGVHQPMREVFPVLASCQRQSTSSMTTPLQLFSYSSPGLPALSQKLWSRESHIASAASSTVSWH